MNKVRIIGLGIIATGIFTGFFFHETGAYMLSGMLIGLGAGWLITGKLHVRSRNRKIPAE
ncbi:hypothetical protein [Gramella sp. KN1008]|uniref:hypothetical protein n=1 Tax=Gramella sp. KN1008 TaxID=2529298 RepID=UPI00103C89DB|nr:hypothetical protein [Gramella sp. KN1008]TBW30026.1 hypothetical protein EZJ28_01070 [Gramella sp. KN1008]